MLATRGISIVQRSSIARINRSKPARAFTTSVKIQSTKPKKLTWGENLLPDLETNALGGKHFVFLGDFRLQIGDERPVYKSQKFLRGLVERHGGRVQNKLSKRVTHVITSRTYVEHTEDGRRCKIIQALIDRKKPAHSIDLILDSIRNEEFVEDDEKYKIFCPVAEMPRQQKLFAHKAI
mmetsp:Transcript_24816/g.27620  ORF Transcript_24816/g.27620 Transcript_24816/m.27620 type:complete len:179 (+) Transcript_24816:46-582(+)